MPNKTQLYEAVEKANALLVAGTILSALSTALPAHAAKEEIDWMIEEIVVTAQKREQTALDVSASLSAFSDDRLGASGIENVLDLANFTPSLSVAENPAGGGFLFIRGIGSNLLGAGADPGVAVYHDGAYIARHVVAFQDFIDVERVEVLRGPQGTLYGRNATGGAVNIIHKKPTEDFTFSTRLDAGNFDKQGVAIAVSGKLIEDKLFGRASFSRQTKESYSTNVFLNDTQDGEDSENAAVTLVFKPTDNVEAVLRYSDFQDDAAGNVALKNIRRSTGTQPALPEPEDEFDVLNDFGSEDSTAETESTSLELTWTIGDITLKSLSAVRDIDSFTTYDVDGTNIPVAFSIIGEDSEMISQEFQLSASLTKTIDLITGLYYYQEENSSELNSQQPNTEAACAAFDQPLSCSNLQIFSSRNDTEAYAVYGELTYSATDNLRFTVGGRYSDEQKDFVTDAGFENFIFDFSVPGFPFTLDASGIASSENSADWSDFTGRFVVEYDLRADLMFYASVAEGFKSGGFNSSDTEATPLGSGAQGPYGPETLTSYELGVKGMLLDGRISGSVSAFLYDYKDLQVRFADPANNTTPIRNASNAEVFGVELEGVAALTRYSRVDLALTHLDSEYKNFDNALDPFSGDEVDFSGESLVRTPDLKLSVGAEYLFPLGDLGSLTVRGEYLYQDKQRFDLSFNPFLEGGEYEYFNARLTWADISGNFYIAAWGQNLNDDVYENSITFASVIGGLAVYASPRTYGITLGYNY